ncbi:decarboxylase [Candidatus Aenigmatarchaeota archaeon]
MSARFLLSRKKAIEQYNIMKDLSDVVSYSVKTNKNIAPILEEQTDAMFSLHFSESIDTIKDKKRVWFLPQSWTENEIVSLLEKGITSFIVDNERDLNALLQALEKKEKKINLLLRMRLKERTIHTGKHFVFGMYSDQVNKLIPALRANKSIDKLGIHFHRKTQNISEWLLKEELEDILNKETLDSIDILDIGGGFPVRYKNHNVEVLPHIFENVKALKGWLNDNGIKMIVEPGRFIAGPAVSLEAKIINIYNNNIVVDCSVYNSAMDTFAAHTRLMIDGELETGENYVIKGCTPCSLDVFRYRVFLASPKIGDKLVFLNAGAYNYSTNFCDLGQIETVVVE